jgi:predicted N-acetyltransferase YhbS
VRDLDLVACEADQIFGHIMYSKARVLADSGDTHEVLCLGPISVMPDHQGRGIGSRLIRESLSRAEDLGFSGVFLMGNPAYYSRFGFRNAGEFGILTSDGCSPDYFIGMELAPGRLAFILGRFFEDEAFHVSPGELENFEKLFPAKEKHVTRTQLWH